MVKFHRNSNIGKDHLYCLVLVLLLVIIHLICMPSFVLNSCDGGSFETSPLAIKSSNGIGSFDLMTVKQIKQSAKLPCNYVHDGFYLSESNELLHQVYQTIFQDLADDDIPVVIEVGGHDGITKSLSLKASICLGVNTMLIEASHKNYDILSQSRRYDRTINAALCESGSVLIKDNSKNSGETKVDETDSTGGNRVRCTTIDAEMDQLRASLPVSLQDKLVLAFLVLDVEGHESIAMKGIQRYTPMKMTMEANKFKLEHKQQLEAFLTQHNLEGQDCSHADVCYNFKNIRQYSKSVFYGSRSKVPEHHWETKRVSSAYQFYGE